MPVSSHVWKHVDISLQTLNCHNEPPLFDLSELLMCMGNALKCFFLV